MRRLIGDITPVQRRRVALGVVVLGLLAAGTALQPPPDVGPRDCPPGLQVGTVKREGVPERVCVLRAGGQTIVVSRAHKGPKRASILSLAAARRLYQGACVANPGRDYVVVSKPGLTKGSNASERMLGFGADDRIDGKLGDDCIDGGAGDDALFGRGGNDLLFGGPGNDDLFGGGGDDNIHGGDGNDTLTGAPGADSLYGGAGDDVIRAGPGADVISAGDGDDTVSAPRPAMRSLNCGRGMDRATVNEANRARVHNCENVTFVVG